MRHLAMVLCSVAALGCSVGGALAEGAWNTDFTFKRVGVPQRSGGSRITVQIAPQAPGGPAKPAPAGTAPPKEDGKGAPSGFDWFWQAVSPKLDDSGPGRLQPALDELDHAPRGKGVAGPRLQTLQEIAAEHGVDILRATVGTQVSPALALAVISVESAGRSDALSHAGAEGLMQLMPPTAARFGVSDSFDTIQNIEGGVAYLDWLMSEFGQDPILVLAGYNAGEGALRENGGVPAFAETRAYVPKVLAAWKVARGLCQTPPMLVSDGCVFAVNAQ